MDKEQKLKDIKKDYKARYKVTPDELTEFGMWYAICYLDGYKRIEEEVTEIVVGKGKRG